MRNLIPLSIAVLIATLLAGCATTPAPVVDRSQGGESASSTITNAQSRAAEHASGSMSSQDYVVARGDTLYSIAFRHGMDYRALAERNNIGPPYIIRPGQVLRLDTAAAPARNAPRESVAAVEPGRENAGEGFGAVENNPPATSAPGGQVPESAAASSSGVTTLPQVNLSQGSTPTANPSQPVARPGATPPRSGEVAAVPAPASNAGGVENSSGTVVHAPPLSTAASGRTRTVDGVTWQWPADGAVISGSDTGLDIAGNAGDPVRAAADGTVVYSGNGLIGYGELIIIKHSDNYLSAYGHNRKRLVQEGQRVRAGQEIAEMGSTGAAREELHFEIRKSGKQVDPAGYLPGR